MFGLCCKKVPSHMFTKASQHGKYFEYRRFQCSVPLRVHSGANLDKFFTSASFHHSPHKRKMWPLL